MTRGRPPVRVLREGRGQAEQALSFDAAPDDAVALYLESQGFAARGRDGLGVFDAAPAGRFFGVEALCLHLAPRRASNSPAGRLAFRASGPSDDADQVLIVPCLKTATADQLVEGARLSVLSEDRSLATIRGFETGNGAGAADPLAEIALILAQDSGGSPATIEILARGWTFDAPEARGAPNYELFYDPVLADRQASELIRAAGRSAHERLALTRSYQAMRRPAPPPNGVWAAEAWRVRLLGPPRDGSTASGGTAEQPRARPEMRDLTDLRAE